MNRAFVLGLLMIACGSTAAMGVTQEPVTSPSPESTIATDTTVETDSRDSVRNALVQIRQILADQLRDGALDARTLTLAMERMRAVEQFLSNPELTPNQAIHQVSLAASEMTNEPLRTAWQHLKTQLEAFEEREVDRVLHAIQDMKAKISTIPADVDSTTIANLLNELTALVDRAERIQGMRQRKPTELNALQQLKMNLSTLDRATVGRSILDQIGELSMLANLNNEPRLAAIANHRRAVLTSNISAHIDSIARALESELPSNPGSERIAQLLSQIEPLEGKFHTDATLQRQASATASAIRGWLESTKFHEQKRYIASLNKLQRARSDFQANELHHRVNLFPEDITTRRITELRTLILQRGEVYADPRLKPIVERIDSAQNLDQLLGAVADLKPWVPVDRESNHDSLIDEGAELLRELQSLQTSVRHLQIAKEGLAAADLIQFRDSFDRYMRNRTRARHRWTESVRRFSRALARDYVQASGILGSRTLEDDPDPGLQLLEIAGIHMVESDFRKALEILTIVRDVLPDPSQTTSIQSDIAAVNLMLQAQNFESAGDIQEAARRYRSVLTFTSPRAPVVAAAARLSELAKQHPAILQEAVLDPTAAKPFPQQPDNIESPE